MRAELLYNDAHNVTEFTLIFSSIANTFAVHRLPAADSQ